MRISNPFRRDPAPPAFGNGNLIPEESTNWLSLLTLHWLSPLLSVGYSRPLEKEDLWGLPNPRLTETLTNQLETLYYQRPERASLSETPSEGTQGETDTSDSDVAPLLRAMHRMILRPFWIAGIMSLCAETLNTTTPLLSKVLLTWLVESYAWAHLGDAERLAFGLTRPRGIGYGIGVAFGLFAMQQTGSILTNHGLKLAMTVGQSLRAGLVGNIVRKSLRLSGRSRGKHGAGQIITMISTDGTNIEQFMGFAHTVWVSPIQLILGFGLLIGTLGYSALVGLGVMLFSFPIQGILVKIFFDQRQKCIKITDKRTQLTTEVLQGIRMIKFYGWESFYIDQIGHFRGQEVKTLRKGALALSSLICVFHFTPILATILSFITYSLTGHDLNIAIIFASLQLFNVIRIPLLLLPIALSSLASAVVALKRIATFIDAEELQEPYLLKNESNLALDVDADFAWETVRKPDDAAGKEKEKGDKGVPAKKTKKTKKTNGEKPETLPEEEKESLPLATQDLDVQASQSTKEEPKEDPPFELKDLRLAIPKGSFVGIVGRVGSGKSSILQAIIGEMRRTRGTVTVGGKIAYAPQVPWIQNATLRDNILFGQEGDDARFNEVIKCCSLQHDLDILPFGAQTEIGEKGINLSGGQKARVSLARVVYSDCDIVLLDDPLSAVDAYVGKSIMDDCILSGPLASKTRILVTHSLHVLPKTDYIYFVENGVVTEQGTYKELAANGKAFARVIEDYGRRESQEKTGAADRSATSRKLETGTTSEALDKDAKDVLMQLEERNTGAVTWNTYKTYALYAGGLSWAPLLCTLLLLGQAISVGTNLWLSFWTANEIPGLANGQYMAVYAGFGAAEALVTFLLSFSFFAMGLVASLRLFKGALSGILHSPLSFFDTTPMGRILSRLTKDVETLDNELAQIIYSFLTIFVALFGIMALVFYTFPYLGIIFAPMSLLYWLIARYYRASSVETKRLDSILRSGLYASFSEMLTGLSTIRAFSVQNRITTGAYQGLDMQNRAYYMTITIQRWLALRLDFFGNLLVLGIALFAAGFRESVNPAKVGLVLSYTLSITAVFSEMISQFATNEQNMNAVERVVHYAELLPEGERQKPRDPPPSWPPEGLIKFDDIHLAYREGLPLVLKGISFEVKPREKIGIVGRTGAGKSSLLHALFRTVNPSQGSIWIDGIDIAEVGLETLRSRLALVPQESTLFLGTLRENIDPLHQRTDAELITVLQRLGLLPQSGTSNPPTAESKFSLDSMIGDEGSNYSVGEKQLLSLCRALVRNSQVIILDEATSNIDVETDTKLQKTIRTEFASATVLCIAHRLNTIAYCDRILVMDDGRVAEFDTVLHLFDTPGSIFRSLCDEANLSRDDIVRIRME